MTSEEIRIVQRVLLEAIVDLFANPPIEVGAKEDLHLHMWQIEEMLKLDDNTLSELDDETNERLAKSKSDNKEVI